MPSGAGLDDAAVTTDRLVEGDLLAAAVRCRRSSTLARGHWHTRRVETDSHMTATPPRSR